MKNRIPWIGMLCVAAFFVAGCDGGSGDGDDGQAGGEGASGSWSMTLVWEGEPGIRSGSASFQQTGNSMSGTVNLGPGTHGSVSGTVSGNSISFSGSAGFTAYNQFSGTINGSTMSGTASSSIIPIKPGTWSAQRK